MKRISLMLQPETIRHRLMLLFTITIVMAVALIAITSYQVISLENDLLTLEQADGLINNILELRRYEKNILLKTEKDSVQKAMQSLYRINRDIKALEPRLAQSAASSPFFSLVSNFNSYNKLFRRWCALNPRPDSTRRKQDITRIRQFGRNMVNDGEELVHHIRGILQVKFKKIVFGVTVVSILIFSCGAAVIWSQTKNILRRLVSLRQATRDLAAGRFTPIHLPGTHDEISSLIVSRNTMVESLEQKQEQLIQSTKMASIGTFSSGIAHEINNPLNNISLSVDMLMEELDELDREEMREILEDIMGQTERASRIVHNLLDFSRAHATEMELLHLDEVLAKTKNLIINELRIHKIALETEIGDNLPPVRGDFQKLQQVFLNLIINAEQAIGEHGRIVLKAMPTSEDTIRVDVSDSGSGIDQQHLERIFDPFFTTKETGKGTGLGLAIVYGIVEKHGGYVEVASKQGEGTIISVHLPVYHSDKNRERKPA